MGSKTERLLSLDVFRGITIAGMVLVNSPGNETAYAPLDHSAWNGCTPTDLVFPFFIFIVGLSLVYSFSSRLAQGKSRSELLAQVLRRTVILFALGLLMNGFPHYNLSLIRIPGVLQRIALCYFFASLAFLYTSTVFEIVGIVAALTGYWWMMTHVGVPGFGAGNLTPEGNLAACVDRMLLGKHLYRPVYDPEGILSTIPAVATALLGNLAGRWLRSVGAQAHKITGLLEAGGVLLLIGWKWDRIFPINKALWTSSYVCWTAGWALLLLAFCYWALEMKGWRRWSRPFEVFGVNAIAVYVLHIFFLKLQNLWHIPQLDGSPGNLRIFISEHLFGWMSRLDPSAAYAASYTLLWMAFAWVLWRKKIFIKI
ncbi:MAG: DUF5009 domain-containing protein [Elusimicrobiota bacterium]|jgi:predicted acyltransferase